VQGVELNRGRLEARCLIRFEATAGRIRFPAVAQAARQTRATDRKAAKAGVLETDWLMCSRSPAEFSAAQMAEADRRHWGIENGLHLGLDVTAGEDRSRVSTPTAVLNLANIRRAVHSLAVRWIERCSDKRQATLRGFYDAMAANRRRKALSLVTARKTSWLPRDESALRRRDVPLTKVACADDPAYGRACARSPDSTATSAPASPRRSATGGASANYL
jgi:predicted transposase YbfD/YdcC